MEDLVPVLVPKSRVLDVYGFLSRSSADAHDDDGGEGDGGESGSPARPIWPADTLQRCYKHGSTKFAEFLDHLADNAERAVSGSVVGDAIGYGGHQLAGMLGAAGRRIDNHYHLPFPFEKEWNATEGVFYYTMPEANAAVIRALRAEA